jgi:murein L,D-transpeptidase YafK
MSAEQRLADVTGRRRAGIEHDLGGKGLHLGSAIFVRIFKESRELELWLQSSSDQAYKLYKTWPIAAFSGVLGPKQREGDRQAPEGFYNVDAARMNPLSKYHLSFNLGYPNAYDTAQGRTGGLLMVHGKNVSIGCYAMTDPVIEEIYLIASAALAAGQRQFLAHCFPFRMTDQRMAQARSQGGEWVSFWEDLHAGWAVFEKTKQVPKISVAAGRYCLRQS